MHTLQGKPGSPGIKGNAGEGGVKVSNHLYISGDYYKHVYYYSIVVLIKLSFLLCLM